MEYINSEKFRQELLRCLHGLDNQIRTLFLQNTGLAEVKEELKQKIGRLVQDHIHLTIDTAAKKHQKQTEHPPANLLEMSGIKTEPKAVDCDDSVTLLNNRPHQRLLPSDETIVPRLLGQKRAKFDGIAEKERPFAFDACKKTKSYGVKRTFGTKPLVFSLKENGEEYMLGCEVSCFKHEESSI